MEWEVKSEGLIAVYNEMLLIKRNCMHATEILLFL